MMDGGGAVMRMILIFAGWSGTGLKAGGPGIISSCKVLPHSFMIWQIGRRPENEIFPLVDIQNIKIYSFTKS